MHRLEYPKKADDPTFTAPRKMTLDGSEHVAGRQLWVGTAGTATITWHDSTTATDFPLKAGLNPLGGIKSIAAGGTASDIWILD